ETPPGRVAQRDAVGCANPVHLVAGAQQRHQPSEPDLYRPVTGHLRGGRFAEAVVALWHRANGRVEPRQPRPLPAFFLWAVRVPVLPEPAPASASNGPSEPSAIPPPRSEEHTSELQSRENLVCRLLL